MVTAIDMAIKQIKNNEEIDETVFLKLNSSREENMNYYYEIFKKTVFLLV